MHRRALLATVGASAAALAGCTASTMRRNVGGRSDRGTPPYPTATDGYNASAFEPESTYATDTVGPREDRTVEPHVLYVWNGAADSRAVELEVTDWYRDDVVFEETYDLPARAVVEVWLTTPEEYTITIRVPADGGEQTLRIPRATFDDYCNTSETTVLVYPDGRIEAMLSSTVLACEPRKGAT